jgi:hypothetical protein
MVNKFENPFPPAEEKPEEQQQETPPEQEPESELSGYERVGDAVELSPEEAEQLKGEMGGYFEQVKKDIEDLKIKIAAEQNEEEKQKMALLLADLEEQSSAFDGDFGPAMEEEEVKITITDLRYKIKPDEGK